MAKIWLARDGDNPTTGEATAERPLTEAVELLGVGKTNFLSDDPKKVRFVRQGEALAMIRGYQHVVVEVEDGEKPGWKPGFYYSPLSPAEALKKLGI